MLIKISRPSIEKILYILLLMCLNHSNVLLGINMSLADLVLVPLTIILVVKNMINVPKKYTIYFIALITSLLFTSFYLVPIFFDVLTKTNEVLVNTFKLFITFIYLILGFNAFRFINYESIFKSYSYVSVFIGLVGTIINILGMRWSVNSLFVFGRLKGLLNDPNYFAVIQSTAIALIIACPNIKKANKIIMVVILLLSILSSGSKTGIICIFLYTIFKLLEVLVSLTRVKLKNVVISSFIVITLFVTVQYTDLLIITQDFFTEFLPGINRVEKLFTNIKGAIAEDGSGRDEAWRAAFTIIKSSPVTGIGVGTYSTLLTLLTNTTSIAHNTYLQIYAEWGILFATVFFLYLIILLISTRYNNKKIYKCSCVGITDYLIIMLIGSMAISLNNARMFWFMFGCLIYLNIIQRRKVNQ